jgi:hypothetical protein
VPRFLVLDWDPKKGDDAGHGLPSGEGVAAEILKTGEGRPVLPDRDRCSLLLGNVSRSGVKIEQAACWEQEEIFGAEQGDAAGKKLKDFLKSAGLTAAPLLVCLPKQRILMKELRCPKVSADEEAALVRFQATKELLENPEDVVVDYAYLSQAQTENLILVTALRRDLLAGYNALAKAAGLKLLAVTPRPFILADLLARCRKIDSMPSGLPPEWSAVLLLGGSWAELTILHGRTVCFARSMVNDDGLEGEVRRSLAMFSSQAQGNSPQILYLFGKGATAQVQDRLGTVLGMPVTRPAVLAKDDISVREVDSPAGVGLLAAWCDEKVAVNFAKPKEPKPPAPSNHRALVLAGVLSVILVALGLMLAQQVLAGIRDQIASVKGLKMEREKKLTSDEFKGARLDIDAFEEWEQGCIPWVDEFYEIADHFPWQPTGFYLTRLDGNVRPGAKLKDKYHARIVLTGVEPSFAQRQVFQSALRDDHMEVSPDNTNKDRFTIILDLARQPAANYRSVMVKPALPKKK